MSEELELSPEEPLECGDCCACGDNDGTVRNLLLLDYEAPSSFEGAWGCFICDLPQRGAIAVVCDDCLTVDQPLRWICGGQYVRDGVRIQLDDYVKRPFKHVESFHKAQNTEAGARVH